MNNHTQIIVTLLCNFLLVNICYSQQQDDTKDSAALHTIPATIGKGEIVENMNSATIKIFDGLRLCEYESIPETVEINNIRRLHDPVKLQKMGIKDFTRNYIFYSSHTTAFHKEVYSMSDIPAELKDLNIPLIVNNKIITPDKYHSVEKIRTSRIKRVEFIKPSNALLNTYGNAILGAIKVSLRAG